MRAMRHGVPTAIIPDVASDQPYVAKAVDEWGECFQRQVGPLAGEQGDGSGHKLSKGRQQWQSCKV